MLELNHKELIIPGLTKTYRIMHITDAHVVVMDQRDEGVVIIDGGAADGSNMGGAMAFAAAESILSYFSESDDRPSDIDMIVTGDLGAVGSGVLRDILSRELPGAQKRHEDCGLLLYDLEKQDAHSGASGCGTSASVLSAYFLPMLETGQMRKILFLSTGALMSPSSLLQGENIFGIAPLIKLESPNF